MSQKDEKQETQGLITRLLIPTGAIVIAISSMFVVSVSIIIFTGMVFGNYQPAEFKKSLKMKSSNVVIISYSKPLEDEIKKSNLGTPELPIQSQYHTKTSLLSFNYRY